MRKLGWLSVGVVLGCLFVAAAETSGEFGTLLNFWSRYLWVFPFSVAISSLFLFVANFILGSIGATRVPGKVLSGVYLTNGPSFALLSAWTSLGIALPPWFNYVTPSMMLTSAWAYYRSLEVPE